MSMASKRRSIGSERRSMGSERRSMGSKRRSMGSKRTVLVLVQSEGRATPTHSNGPALTARIHPAGLGASVSRH
jgi:hypothetical protein